MIKLFIIVFILLSSGCSTFEVMKKNGKVYITTDVLPPITNDKGYGADPGTHHRIMINGKIEYRIIHTF